MKPSRWLTLLAAAWGAFALSPGLASADEAAVRKAIANYVEAFNKHDLKSIAALWAEKGTHVDRETGERTEGRAQIETDIAAVFKSSPETRLAGQVERVRMVTPDVAQVEGQTTLLSPDAEPQSSSFSAILVNHEGTWQIDSIEELPQAQPTHASEALSDLEWLVGRWVDSSEHAHVDTTFRWPPSRTFLLR